MIVSLSKLLENKYLNDEARKDPVFSSGYQFQLFPREAVPLSISDSLIELSHGVTVDGRGVACSFTYK